MDRQVLRRGGEFPVDGRDEKITVYTTRPDTLYGATFMVLAPEHKLAKELATDETRAAVEKYILDSSMRSNVDRMQDKEKDRRVYRQLCREPLKRREDPHLAVGLRAGRLRHRRHYVRAGP